MTNTRHGHGGGLAATIPYRCLVVKPFGLICEEVRLGLASDCAVNRLRLARAPYRRAAINPSPGASRDGRTGGGLPCGPDRGRSACRKPRRCGPARGGPDPCSCASWTNDPGVVAPEAM